MTAPAFAELAAATNYSFLYGAASPKEMVKEAVGLGMTGIGIADENLEKVFTKFYQVDGSTRRKAEGTGLGLTICKAIIEEGHHGRIWAEHRGGGPGTRMVATFPL